MPLVDGALLVLERRSAVFEPSLGMRCDQHEVPMPLHDGGGVAGWWIAGKAQFFGSAAGAIEDGQLIEPETVGIEGTAAVVIAAKRVFGIISPDDYTRPALWWSWALPSLKVSTEGRQGVFPKRPRIVVIERGSAVVDLLTVSRLNRDSGRHRPGQEHRLAAALTV